MTPYSGTSSVTPGFATSTKIDLNQIGEARNSMLGIKLDQVRLWARAGQLLMSATSFNLSDLRN